MNSACQKSILLTFRTCLAPLAAAFLSFGCAQSGSDTVDQCTASSASIGGSGAKSPVSYCSTPKTFSGQTVTVSGQADYKYRINGNGKISNHVSNASHALIPIPGQSQYSVTISGNTFSCTTSCTGYEAVRKIANDINTEANTPGSSISGIKATGVKSLVLWRKNSPYAAISITSSGFQVTTGAHPIRHAEIRVTKANGTAIEQCAETDEYGNFSLTLPKNSGDYRIYVTSRASNAHNSAYVLKDPTGNEFHSIYSDVSTTADVANITISAPANSTLEGGAFNILDQILNAQDYLREETANCNATFSGCTPFTVAPRVNVYWSAGVTPGKYLGAPSSPISFYLIGKKQLFILGGLNGNTSTVDMDHFDNSVILHEYAHFLEDMYSKPDSPGGSHSGNQAIDPRLAWGEGFANFFQAAVHNDPVYRDTVAHVDCGSCMTGAAFNESLVQSDPNNQDIPLLPGEGNFREFSIARLLWQIVDMANTGFDFAEIWRNLNGTNSMRTLNENMKSMSDFHKLQMSFTSDKTDWSSFVDTEKQSETREHYLTPITLTSAAACASSPISMTVSKYLYPDGTADDGSFEASDQYRSNDFFIYNHPGGALNLKLSWTGPESVDLDVYLYRSRYSFGDLSSCSVAAYDYTSNLGTTGSEAISLSNLAAGRYVINVMGATGEVGAGDYSTTYNLEINGKTVCPYF